MDKQELLKFIGTAIETGLISFRDIQKAHGPKAGKIPTIEEVAEYCRERANAVDPEAFVDYYASQGWKKANGRPILDWRACVRTWEKTERKAAGPDQDASKAKRGQAWKRALPELYGGR